MTLDTDLNVEQLQLLIEQWNADDTEARDKLVVYVQPFIEKFSTLEFSKGKVISTPLKLFSTSDLAQTVSEKLLAKHKYLSFSSVDDMFILLRKMVYSTFIDEARKLTNSKHGLGDRIKASDCEEELPADDSFDSSHTFIALEQILTKLENIAKQQAVAFSLYRLWGLEVKQILLILNVSESTFYRYLEFSDAFISIQLKGS